MPQTNLNMPANLSTAAKGRVPVSKRVDRALAVAPTVTSVSKRLVRSSLSFLSLSLCLPSIRLSAVSTVCLFACLN